MTICTQKSTFREGSDDLLLTLGEEMPLNARQGLAHSITLFQFD